MYVLGIQTNCILFFPFQTPTMVESAESVGTTAPRDRWPFRRRLYGPSDSPCLLKFKYYRR
jgi:hypothetical protein